ncbi:MAG TPA: hypothetical protein VM389_05495 [Phycisphaerae bacterium]|nr:hypothetical protein [Phycisphaerae bacterium]HUU59195.1 hypothetical protein [Phycisphaerae bacterium]
MTDQTEQTEATEQPKPEPDPALAAADAERVAVEAALAAEDAAKAAVVAREAAAAVIARENGIEEIVPAQPREITDIEAAVWLESFQERSLEVQQASPVWQALVGFPQWAGAQFGGGDEPTAQMPINPRLTGDHRRRELERRGETETVASVKKPDGTNTITTQQLGQGASNPWADHRLPEGAGDGPLFIGVDTNVKPPYAGAWVRRDGGWFRTGEKG